MHWLFVAASRLSPVAVKGAAVHGLLTAVASLVEERGLRSTGSVVVVRGLSCPGASSQTRDRSRVPLCRTC